MLETIGIIGALIGVTMLARYLGRIHAETFDKACPDRKKEIIDAQCAAWEKEDELKQIRSLK